MSGGIDKRQNFIPSDRIQAPAKRGPFVGREANGHQIELQLCPICDSLGMIQIRTAMICQAIVLIDFKLI